MAYPVSCPEGTFCASDLCSVWLINDPQKFRTYPSVLDSFSIWWKSRFNVAPSDGFLGSCREGRYHYPKEFQLWLSTCKTVLFYTRVCCLLPPPFQGASNWDRFFSRRKPRTIRFVDHGLRLVWRYPSLYFSVGEYLRLQHLSLLVIFFFSSDTWPYLVQTVGREYCCRRFFEGRTWPVQDFSLRKSIFGTFRSRCTRSEPSRRCQSPKSSCSYGAHHCVSLQIVVF